MAQTRTLRILLVLALLAGTPACFWGGDNNYSNKLTTQLNGVTPGDPGITDPPGPTPTPPPTPPGLALSTTDLDFGVSGTSLFFEAWNFGTGSVTATIAGDQSWLGLSQPDITSAGPLDHQLVVVTLDRSGLSAGMHTAHITVTPNTGTPQTIDVTLSVGIIATDLLTASRTGGTTPLAVNFDAVDAFVWTDLQNLQFVWDFGDGGAAQGYLAAHVYELASGDPTTAFTVTLSVYQDGFLLATDSTTVTVDPFSGATTCVSLVGDFTGCPGGASEQTSLTAGWSAVAANGRLLLHRGETFDLSAPLTTAVNGVLLSDYGTPSDPKPLLTVTGTSSALIVQNGDWRIVNLEIAADDTHTVPAVIVDAPDFLSLRNDIHDVFAGFFASGTGFDFATDQFYVETNVAAAQSTSFVAGTGISFIGSQLEDLGTDFPALTVAGAHRTLLAYSHFNAPKSNFAVMLRGDNLPDVTTDSGRDGLENVYLTYNSFDQGVAVRPQSSSAGEAVSNVGIEKNYFGTNVDTYSTRYGVQISALNGVVRNNLFYNHRRAVSLETVTMGAPNTNIAVLGNTVYNPDDADYDPLMPSVEDHYLVKVDSDSRNVRVHDNVIHAVGHGTATKVIVGDAFLLVKSNNLGSFPNVPGECLSIAGNKGSSFCFTPAVFASTTYGDADFLRPLGSSPMSNTGLAVEGLFDDAVSATRGLPPDVGCFEVP